MADGIIIKTFRFKLRKNKAFEIAAEKALDASRLVYNCALEQRISRYRQGKPVGYFEQSRELTEARTLPDVGSCLRAIQEDALKQIDRAFKAFFRRTYAGLPPGFPRFKSFTQYSTFSQQIERKRVTPIIGDLLTVPGVPGVGACRVRLSRKIEGTAKHIHVSKRVDGWYVVLVCETIAPITLIKTNKSVGIDLGLETFATLSNGEKINNPRLFRRKERTLKRSQRALTAKQLRSANRLKARFRLAKKYLKVSRARKDFHQKVALDLVNRFDTIRAEDLQINNMLRNKNLAKSIKKSISDAGWGQFLRILSYKAEWAGRVFERVDPRYTSQTCSRCSHRQKMPLALRLYECSNCGLVLHRDHNAAINIRQGMPESTPAEFIDVTWTLKQE
jgi:putative transposase